jgi:lipid A 4'-phosphatase
VFTFLIVWLVYALLYRWPATRITDEQVERTIEKMVLPIQERALRLISRRGGSKAGEQP